jgi:hypothetical protein
MVMTAKLRHRIWRGAEDADRIETATARLGSDRLQARGTATARDYVTSWSLDVGAGWITRELSVCAFGEGWRRRLELRRHPDGAWTSSTAADGAPDLPPPGILDHDALYGALDCDLGLCPLTNTMPIRRLGLLGHAVPETPLVMAWVDIPSLQVIRSDQLYSTGSVFDAARGHAVVTYQSMSRDFQGELTVDEDGIVIDYPQLAYAAQLS